MPKKKTTKKVEPKPEPTVEKPRIPEAPPVPPTPPAPKKATIPVDEIMQKVKESGSDAMKQATVLENELKKRGISRDAWVKALIVWRTKRR